MAKKKTAKNPVKTPVAEANDAVAPALSYITESLRPLAIACDTLVLDPANARKHPEKNLSAVKASLRVYGHAKPIVVNRRGNVVEAGNGTLEAARALGWSHVAAVLVDDDATTAAGFGIADNRSAELAEWDQEALDALLATVSSDDAELQEMLDSLKSEEGTPAEVTEDEPPSIDQAAELQAKWGTASGQLWEIPSKTAPARRVAICPNCQHKNPVK